MYEPVVGLTGPRTVGKDTLVRAMQVRATDGWVFLHSKFALGLRGLVYLIQGLDITMAGDRAYEADHGVVNTMIAVSKEALALDQLLWVEVEAHLRARLLQDFVSRGFRKVMVVISDVRQEHEQLAIAQSDGIVVELSRGGVFNDPARLDGQLETGFKIELTLPEADAVTLQDLALVQAGWDCRRSLTETQTLRRLAKVMEDLNLGGPDDPAQVLELAWQYLRSLNPQSLATQPVQPNAFGEKP